ncbi:S-methyl-5'-thioinosine phosphorylase [Agarilytica rhodophyticola]|uniref:S-methyl-5'-thioinosine phosphorylase n=1 Tax=Agarilytica rhodophyticola TaxID=1737490 RepID=UPI000B34926F|nr:S-methyl-5'-thioinosine phosphorylase [Agarilytica rhodophyticola]
MKTIGIIGGSGFYNYPELGETNVISVDTAYGKVNAIAEASLNGNKILFLPRHGEGHKTPPHKVNYRANIEALHQLGATHVLAFNVVGGIGEKCAPGTMVVPDQIIDYTYGREHTFFDGFENELAHIDFGEPFSEEIRQALIKTLSGSEFEYLNQGTYGCTQGPRLESAAEIRKLRNDGCDLVGMTLMPEAALAREKGLQYASLCFVANWGAGMENEKVLIDNILALLNSFVPKIREIILKTTRFL